MLLTWNVLSISALIAPNALGDYKPPQDITAEEVCSRH